MDLRTISRTLILDPSGIWSTHEAAAGISFPEDGHAECFAIEDESFWFAHRNDCISSALARSAFDGPFLDVGGGNGAVSKRLAADGFDTVLLEPGPSGARNARKRGLANVICATLEQAAFAPSSFGGAGLFDVIEHVEDDVRLLQKVRRILSGGAVVGVTVPAYAWLWSAEDVVAGHFRRYTVGGLRAVLERAGFVVEYATYIFAPLVGPLFAGRSLRYRLQPRAVADTGRAAAQHTPGRISRKVMAGLLAPEVAVVRRRGRIPFGTSILAIARTD